MGARIAGFSVVVLLTLLLLVVLLHAAPPIALLVYGTVLVNDENVAEGTEVAAWCSGVWSGSDPTEFDGGISVYGVDVLGDDPDEPGKDGCHPGETVTFTVDGLPADQATIWVSGAVTEVHLTAFRPIPQIEIEKYTLGEDADLSPGPTLLVSQTVTWTYILSNTGNVTLTQVALTDDRIGVVECPGTTLAVWDQTFCTATGDAIAGPYTNTATASALYGSTVVSDTDLSHYFGADPGIDLEKRTNGQDADAAPGPYVTVGGAVTWTYWVENVGNVDLAGVELVDDNGTPGEPLDDYVCVIGALAAGAVDASTCAQSSLAEEGHFGNQATVTGTPPVGDLVSDSDPSHYYGSDASIVLEKHTNGADADSLPGPYVLVSDTVTWTYQVSNTGNVTLTNVTLVDSEEMTVPCPSDTLGIREMMECTATGVAARGQYTNTGVVTGTPPSGQVLVSASDLSHYFGAGPRIGIEKNTNGLDADYPPGPLVLVSGSVTWTYRVSNTGNVVLADVTVTDSHGVTVSCPPGPLEVEASIVCTATGEAIAGQYTNLGTASAVYEGTVVTGTDVSHYFGAEPAIDLEKYTNGQDADQATGPYILAGEGVTWTYWVKNAGNVGLTAVTVVDDNGTTGNPSDDYICLIGALAAGAEDGTTCAQFGPAEAGQQANQAAVTGTPPLGDPVSDADPSHYFGMELSLDLEKSTNGQDADDPVGPYVVVGEPVTWTYWVKNAGNVELVDVAVVDDNGTPANSADDYECVIGSLAAGAVDDETCVQYGPAEAGQYANQAAVTGTPPAGDLVPDEDRSHYFGYSLEPAIDIQKRTNGVDADAPPGLFVVAGGAITWTYLVANGGNVDLVDVMVTDSHGVTVTCPTAELVVSDTMTCMAEGSAVAGQYTNIGTVTGVPATGGEAVSDSDPSHYFGTGPGVSLEKSTNGYDADEGPGPEIVKGSYVTWTYVVENTGNITLTHLVVTDDQGVDIICPVTEPELGAGRSITCAAYGIAGLGPYTNVGEVTAMPPVGAAVGSEDASHYLGVPPTRFVYLPLIMR